MFCTEAPTCRSDISSMKKKSMEYWWNDDDNGKPKRATARKPFPSATWSTEYMTWAGL